MTNGIVVDANIINLFIQEEIGVKGDVHHLITTIKNSEGFALDNIIEQEWRSTAGNPFFSFWFDEALKNEKINYITDGKNISNSEKRKLDQDYGFPIRQSRDIHYIKCAINTEKKYIYTDDIDFYDPRMKSAAHDTKERIKRARSSQLCRYLSRQWGITVGRTEHCYCDLEIPASGV